MYWNVPAEAMKTIAQTLREKKRLNGNEREKSIVAVVVIMMMLTKKICKKLKWRW